MPESVESLATRIKNAYPDYGDVDNLELVQRVTAKYPDYLAHLPSDQQALVAGGAPVAPVRAPAAVDVEEQGLLGTAASALPDAYPTQPGAPQPTRVASAPRPAPPVDEGHNAEHPRPTSAGNVRMPPVALLPAHETLPPSEPGPVTLEQARPSFSGEIPGAVPTGTIKAAPPLGVLQRLANILTGSPGSGETPIGRALGVRHFGPAQPEQPPTELPMLRPEAAYEEPGAVHGALEFAGGFTTPKNLGIMAATQGLGLIGPAASTAQRLISAGFSYQMVKGAVEQFPEFRQALEEGDYARAREIGTQMLLAGGTAALGVRHAAGDVYGREIGRITPEEGERYLRAPVLRAGRERAQMPQETPAESLPAEPIPAASLARPAEAAPQDLPSETPLAPAPEVARQVEPLGAEPGEPPRRGAVGAMRTADIARDPHRFQYKLETDAAGASPLLKDQTRFNPELAGVVSVWRDPANGETYVVNGHHRLDLAERAGQPEIAVRHLVADTAEQARAMGALQNIAEGRGTAVDAAKFFRDTGLTPEELQAQGISMGEATAREGVALSRLDDSLFNQVVNRDMRLRRGVAIGEATADPAEQRAIANLIAKKERGGRAINDETLRELVRLAKSSGRTTEATASLFGEEQVTRSLALEKAEVSAYVKEHLSRDRRLFGFVSKEGRAEELQRGGNVIDVAESQRIASEAAQAGEVYDRLSERAGPVAQVLDEASRQLAQGANPHDVKQQTYERIRQAVSQTLAGRQAQGAERGEAHPGPGARPQAEAAPGVEPGRRLSFQVTSGKNPQGRTVYGVEAFDGARNVGRINLQRVGNSLHVAWTELEDAYRGKGYARQLYEQAAQVAREQGFSKLKSDPKAMTTLSAQRVWESLVREGRAQRVGTHYEMGVKTAAAGVPGFLRKLQAKSEAPAPAAAPPVAEPTPSAAEAEPAPTPAAPVVPAIRAGRKAKGPSSLDVIREAYQPGNVVKSYTGYDKVLTFQDSGSPYGGGWQVEVIASDKQGNLLPGERPRWHATPPEKADFAAAKQRLQAKPQTTAPQPAGTLPGMEKAVEEQHAAAAEEQGRQLTRDITAQPESVSQAAGEMERESPLFRESEAGGQKNLFGGSKSSEAGFATPSMLTGGLLDKADIPAVLERFAGISEGQRLTSESRGIVRENLAVLARKRVVAEKAMEAEARRMDKLPLEARYDFINRMERGQHQATPANQQLADTLRRMLDEKRTEVQKLGTGALQNFITNYFPHVWEKADAAAQVLARIYSRRPLAGPKSFLKPRSIPTFAEGIAAGLKPVSDNPVTLTLLKLHEMDRYIFAQRILEEYKDSGLAHFVRFGERPPDGYAKINDAIARALQYSEHEGGFIVRGEYYAPEPAARSINRYLSPGLSQGLRQVGYHRAALAYEVTRGFGNTLNQAQLGISGFHGVFTSVDSMISDTALGIERITRGQPQKAVLPLLRAVTFTSPLETYLTGSKVLKEYERPGTQGAHIAAIVDALEKGGGRARMDAFYKSNAVQNFWKAFERRSPSVAWRWLPAFFEYAAKPLMEHTVPRMKLGVFHNLAQMELERLQAPGKGELFHAPSDVQLREAMGKAWDSVDNRMGQLVYDNLFWNRAAKDLGMVAIRSLGWNIGTVREIGGGLLDVARQPLRAALGEKAEVTHRMAYVVAMPVTVGWIGAVIGYLATGQRPQELKDYFFPRTGRMLPNGEPERFNIPSYVKDVLEVAKQPVRTVSGKLHPLVHATADFLENKDFEGREIRHPDDPLVKQLADSLGFAASQLLPISARTALRVRESGATPQRQALSFFGLNPAPRNITRTKAETLALELGQRYAPQGPTTAEQFARHEQSRTLLEKLRNRDIAPRQVFQAAREGKITERDARRILEASRRPPIVSTFQRLPLEDALKVWDVATPAERHELRPALIRKTGSLENQPPAKRRELVRKLREALRAARPSAEPAAH